MSSQKNGSPISPKTLAARVKKVLDESGLTQAQAAARLGVDQSSISDWTKGKHAPSSAAKKAFCREFSINEDWLERGSGAMRVDVVREGSPVYGFDIPTGIAEDIPVVGRGRGGRGEFNVDGYPTGQGHKRVRRPYDVLDPNAFGVEVRGESMAPRYEQGDIVICSPAKGWKSGDYCVVIKEDGEALVKKVKEQGDSVILSSLAPGFDPIMLHKKDIRAIHKIVWRKER